MYPLDDQGDQSMEGFELRELVKVREWLGGQAESAAGRAEADAARHVEMDRREAEVARQRDQSLGKQCRLQENYENCTVTLDGVTTGVPKRAAMFLHILLEKGDYMSLAEIGKAMAALLNIAEVGHPERGRDELPEDVLALIEYGRGKTKHRIAPEAYGVVRPLLG